VKILTLTHAIPDLTTDIMVDTEGKVSWDNNKPIINPPDEYAIEEAIIQAKNADGTSIALAIGGEQHTNALKHALAMGIHEAIRVNFETTDNLTYATIAAAAIENVRGVDLVLLGRERFDVDSNLHIYQTARKLGWTLLASTSQILEVDSAEKIIKVEKTLEYGKQILAAKLPAVISVLKGINEPRYPTLLRHRNISDTTIQVWSVDDLGIHVPKAKTTAIEYKTPSTKNTTPEIIGGESPEEKAAVLVDKLIEERII